MLAQQLIDAAVATGREGVVEVNQRDLVDKMLARYSSEHVVLRELLQNADDARASHVEFRFTTGASASAASLKGRGGPKRDTVVTELREINNGSLFSEDDWTRVARIAEGNPSEDSVGMFGVGFYSVFSLTESPLVASGDACLAFKWAGVKLATFRSSLPASEALAFTPLPSDALSALNSAKPSPATTAVMLPMREPRAWDLADLHTFFLRAMAFISRVQRVAVVQDGVVQFVVDRTDAAVPPAFRSKPVKPAAVIASSSGLFGADALTVTSRRVRLWTSAKLVTVSLVHVSAVLTVRADGDFRLKCARILKKQLPGHTTVQLLFTDAHQGTDAPAAIQKALLPFGTNLKPAGRVFIGLSTHQSTGTAFHCHAQLVPTVERENIDFQDPYLGRWNAELLECVGQAARVHYNNAITAWSSHKPALQPWFRPVDPSDMASLSPSELAVLSSSMLEDSHPSLKVCQHLRDGFFAGPPVPLVTSCGVTPCDRVLLPSHGLDAFMWQSRSPSTPIASSLLCSLSPGFAKQLLAHGAQLLTIDGLKTWAADAILQPQQLVALLTWLSGAGKKVLKADAAREVLACVTFVGSDGCPVSWHCVKYFASGIHPSLPVPECTLPSEVSAALSSSELSRLGLKPLSTKTWLKLVDKRFRDVFGSVSSAECALSYLSQSMGTFTAADWQAVTRLLGDAACIPCTVGTKKVVLARPCDAWFVPHGAESPEPSAPIVSLTVIDSDAAISASRSGEDRSDDDDDVLFDVDVSDDTLSKPQSTSSHAASVSFELLKRLGVKRVSTVGPLLAELRDATNTFQRLSALKAIASQWHGLKDVERAEIASTPCLPAVVDNGSASVTLQPPNSLVFPFVVSDISQSGPGRTALSVVHVPELALRPTSEHTTLLKLIGVRECPRLPDMLRLCTARDGLGFSALRYFLARLRSHYSGGGDDKYVGKKVTQAFLPCCAVQSSPTAVTAPVSKRGKKRAAAVVDLTEDSPFDGVTWEQACSIGVDGYATPSDVFESPNPFGPCLHPAVRLALAEADVTGSELGVKAFPTADSVLQLVTKQPPASLHDAITLMASIQTHCTGLTAAMYSKFGATAFVPIDGDLVCPKDVFVAADSSTQRGNGTVPVKTTARKPAKRRVLRQLSTNTTEDTEVCGLGVDVSETPDAAASLPSFEELRGLVHFVDAGCDGNAFLMSCGASTHPSPVQLARALVHNFASYRAAQPPESFVLRYVKVLQLLAVRFHELPASVKAEVKSSLQLPAMRGGASVATEPVVFKHASQLYLVDDPALEAVVRPYIPVSGDLYKLCGLLGCKWLSTAVEQVPTVTAPLQLSPLAAALLDRIQSRSELMVRNHRGELLTGLKPDALSWLKSLHVAEASGIQMRLSFEGKSVALSGAQAITTCVTLPPSVKEKRSLTTLCFVREHTASESAQRDDKSGVAGVALYDVANELAKGLFLEAECQSRLPGLDFVLSSPLALLRRRGMPVDRFLRTSDLAKPPQTLRVVSTGATGSADGTNALGLDEDGSGDVVEVVQHKRRPAFVPEVETSRDVSQLLKCSAPSGTGCTSRARVRHQEAEEDDCDVDMDLVPVNNTRSFPVQFMTTSDAKPYLSPAVLSAASIFGRLLASLAEDVFRMANTRGIVMYADVDHPLIAFNRQGTLYFSLRYFVQCHTRLAWAKEGSVKYNGLQTKAPVQADVVPTFWFVMFCHELAHNGVTEHNCRFNSLEEALFVSHSALFHAHQPDLYDTFKSSMEDVCDV